MLLRPTARVLKQLPTRALYSTARTPLLNSSFSRWPQPTVFSARVRVSRRLYSYSLLTLDLADLFHIIATSFSCTTTACTSRQAREHLHYPERSHRRSHLCMPCYRLLCPTGRAGNSNSPPFCGGSLGSGTLASLLQPKRELTSSFSPPLAGRWMARSQVQHGYGAR
jgi:hypothetical protein